MTARRASSATKHQVELDHAVDRLVDEALQESFPASDPPFFVGAGAGPVGVLHTTKVDAIVARNGSRPARQSKS